MISRSPQSLEEALDELIALARALRLDPSRVPEVVLTNDSRQTNMSRLEALVASIRYFARPPTAARITTPRPVNPTVGCGESGCEATAATTDACLLWFPTLGWRCREHQPPAGAGVSRPVGWQGTAAEREELEAKRREARQSIPKAQQQLLNSRIL